MSQHLKKYGKEFERNNKNQLVWKFGIQEIGKYQKKTGNGETWSTEISKDKRW